MLLDRINAARATSKPLSAEGLDGLVRRMAATPQGAMSAGAIDLIAPNLAVEARTQLSAVVAKAREQLSQPTATVTGLCRLADHPRAFVQIAGNRAHVGTAGRTAVFRTCRSKAMK